MKFLLILLLLPLCSIAQTEMDQKLQGYIEKFQLKPLSGPKGMNRPLFGLGQTLFTSKLLSGNNNIGCVDCHFPGGMTIDGLPLGVGEGAKGQNTPNSRRSQGTGVMLARNTPALFNLNGINSMFWDGRVSYDPLTKSFSTPVKEISGTNPSRPDIAHTLTSALAAQAIFPIANHDEMTGVPGSNPIANAKDEVEIWDLIIQKLNSDPQMKATLNAVFPGETINIGHIGNALAEFQRFAFSFNDTAYDRYLRGDLKAMTEVQKIGMDVFFNKGKCGECHQGEHLSNFEFHNVGVLQIGPGKQDGDDFGRYQWDPLAANLYAFRVPPLRNVAMTAPYMHDGSIKTLPLVVEHYDDVLADIKKFKLINNWKNYVEVISDHNHATDAVRLASLSTKLTTKLNFEPENEKALAEFLQTALTDKAFLNREIDSDYRTYLRLQLRESGFNKLAALYPGKAERQIYYYFDLILEGGFRLKGLTKPMRLIFVKTPSESQLIFREQEYKTATAANGVVLEGNFNLQENVTLTEDVFAPLENSYLDMFNRIYTYHDGVKNEEIPTAELSVIKNDIMAMNESFHKIKFNGAEKISDEVNLSEDAIFYVPSSYNAKDVILFQLKVNGKMVEANLQKSYLRTETGAIQVTYGLELETGKVSKKDYDAFSKALLEKLNVLEASDVGGGTPSPSELTLKVLNQVL
jgi:cytochrome c peroxidase